MIKDIVNLDKKLNQLATTSKNERKKLRNQLLNRIEEVEEGIKKAKQEESKVHIANFGKEVVAVGWLIVAALINNMPAPIIWTYSSLWIWLLLTIASGYFIYVKFRPKKEAE